MKTKSKKCKSCGVEFTPHRPMQIVCDWECAGALNFFTKAKKKLRAIRLEQSKGRKELKTRREWLQDTQKAFNKFIRTRDANEPCISCNRHHTGQYHAGHYMATSVRPNLRFTEDNVHKQCQPCNTHLSGNLLCYRINLIKKIGQARVDVLEGEVVEKKWTIDELKLIQQQYHKLNKEMI